jgi:hypothetical protein
MLSFIDSKFNKTTVQIFKIVPYNNLKKIKLKMIENEVEFLYTLLVVK